MSGSPTNSEGYVVGAYNLIFHTTDGGKTWEPWVERTQNERFYHLYGIRGSSDGVYMVGELGLALRLDPRPAASPHCRPRTKAATSAC